MDDRAVAVEESEVVDFVYSIGGDSNLDLNELIPILQALGEVIQEGHRVLSPEAGEIQISVKPFETGSFPIELLLSPNAQYALLAAYNAGGVPAIIAALETIGLIKSKVHEFVSLLELLKKLKGQPPQEIKPVENGKKFVVKGHDNQLTEINGPVQNVYNNPVITDNLTIIYANAFQKPSRDKVQSFIKGDCDSLVEVTKEMASDIKEAPMPEPPEVNPEVTEHTNVVFLNPKRGSFEGEGDQWSFRKGGKQGEIIRANIKDQSFLDKLGSGEYRLNGGDVLKVQLHEKQRVVGSSIRTTNEIVKVLDYKEAPNRPTQRPLFDDRQVD